MPAFDSNYWQKQQRLADFDRLLASLHAWVEGLPEWEAFDRAKALWSRVAPRLNELAVNLDRVLVVGIVGGTGTGKSTLINAIVGRRLCEAGDVVRPTTTRPVIVHHPSVDPSFLPLSDDKPEVRSAAVPLLENVILVDCPDPDTQGALRIAGTSDDETEPDEESNNVAANSRNRNLEILRRLLPHCDVLVHVGTAQKYKTQAVVQELREHAPGRQIVFVQTHAATDADIRADWGRSLESSGFDVPTVFRIDSEEALSRREHGEPASSEFNELLEFLNRELAERGRARIKRANALDLVDWYVETVERDVQAAVPALTALEDAATAEQMRLFGKVRERLHEQLRESRGLWRRRLLRQTTERWSGGPFASFVRLTTSAGSLMRFLPLARVRGLAPLVIAGGVGAGKAVVQQWRESLSATDWITAADLGVNQADITESRSVLEGTARQAGLDNDVSLREKNRSREQAAEESLAAIAGKLHGHIERAIADVAEGRTRRRAGAFFHLLLEALFCLLPALFLALLAYNFFYEHGWLSFAEPQRVVKPVYGLEYLVQALLWVVVWGLVLRGLLAWRLLSGLTRDIRRVLDELTPASVLGPLFGDLLAATHNIRQQAATLGSFRDQTQQLRAELFDTGEGRADWQLGRLRSAV